MFLKSALFAAALAAVRTKSSYDRDKYNRLRARRGPVRAIMAVAHKLLVAAFHMLSTCIAFRDLGESYLDQVVRRRSTAKLVQSLSNLGYDVMLVLKAAWPSGHTSEVYFHNSLTKCTYQRENLCRPASRVHQPRRCHIAKHRTVAPESPSPSLAQEAEDF